MRVVLVAAAIVVTVACTPAGVTPTPSTPTSGPPATTSLASTTSLPTTTSTTAALTLVLGEEEAPAVDRGARLEISNQSGEVLGWVDRESPELEVDPSTNRLTIRYLSVDGSRADPVWEQETELPVTILRQPWRDGDGCTVTLPDGTSAPVRLVWQAGESSATYLEQLDNTAGSVTVVSPIWWRLGLDGTVSSTVDPNYVEAVHQRNTAIWPAVAGFDADTHHLVFSDPQRRTALAAEISDEAQRVGADGINIDIEGYRAEDSDGFLAWVEELTRLVHDWGGVVSHDLVPRSDSWDVKPDELGFWSSAPPRAALSRATDCTVLMAYDQYNRYRPAGPVASPQWVEEMLIYALRHTDPAQLVLGVPFYGRIWDPADLERPTAVGIGVLEGLTGDGLVSYDSSHGLDRVDLPDGRFYWAETTEELGHRFDLVARYGLAGWAAWRFGFDNPDIWRLIGDRG